MRAYFILLLSVLFIPGLAAQNTTKGLKDAKAMKSESDAIAKAFAMGDIDGAFDRVKTLWVFEQSEMDQLAIQTKEQIQTVLGRYGQPIDAKLAREEGIPDVLNKLTYLVRHEWHGLRLVFYYYKGKDDLWYLNNFSWDDNLTELLMD